MALKQSEVRYFFLGPQNKSRKISKIRPKLLWGILDLAFWPGTDVSLLGLASLISRNSLKFSEEHCLKYVQ